MSIIYGIRKRPETVVTQPELLQLAAPTARFAPDGTSVNTLGRVGMGFQPYHTHERSNLESQPLIDTRGNLLSLDGRIDNHAEVRELLNIRETDMPDSCIVLAAFLVWGETCFSKLVGDWALALWSAAEQLVYLARDHAGTRSLYFRNVAGVLHWSTHLETFFADGSTFSLDQRYAACFLGSQSIRNLTPYDGIEAVPPAHYLAVSDHHVRKESHWDCVAKDQIRYQSDLDYEDHFLHLFRQSVLRRTGPGAPILAQLSGGMDSTAIVCVSDQVRRSCTPGSGLVDTLSFYDDSEPNWNERPYFSIVENRRGKTGIHIATSFLDRTFEPPDPSENSYLLPWADSSTLEMERKLDGYLSGGRYRAILSGIGGDEVLGGVPAPWPELADYLVSGDLSSLLGRTLSWCLVDRTPFVHLLFATIKFTGRLYWRSHIDRTTMPPWISLDLEKICIELAASAARKDQGFGISPSAISNGLTWWSIMETLPHLAPSALTRYEYRYPYLDRDLVDFLFRIPRAQLIRPGRRRSLMRRALRNIVPTEILERRRKAFLIRGPLAALERSQSKVEALFADSMAIQYGLIDGARFRKAMDFIIAGADPKLRSGIYKAISFELWLRANSRNFGTLCVAQS
jgi:asparagine synthase (glutamine-hydrolysing)